MTRIASRLLAALSFILLAVAPALAQNYNVANHAVPIGRGINVSAFGAAAPSSAGQVLLDKGASTNPAFTALGGDVSSVNSSGSVTLDPEIHCLAALTSAADKIAYYTGSGTCALADFPSAERTYLTTPSSANLRGVLNDETGTGLAYFQGGALGTPSSGTLTNATGLPISTGVSGLGTGIATALGVNTGSAGAPVLFNGAGGTPSSLTLTNATGLPVAGITSSTSTALGVGSIELGNASDTTVARASAGLISVEGVNVPTTSSTDTLSNKTLASPIATGTADVQQAQKWSGDISPSQITSNQNDYAPTGFSTATTLRLNTDASRNITGLAGGSGGRVIVIHNVGSFNIVLTNQDAASTAANRFLFGGDVTLAADASLTLKYDGTSSRWRALSSTAAAGGGGGSVTSVAIAAGTGISTSGTCTITTSGTCTVGLATPVAATNGGTAQSTYTTGDTLYASASNTLSKLSIGTSGQALVVSSGAPAWGSVITLGSPTATTSGTTVDYTSIPSWVRKITCSFVGVQINATTDLAIQIGDSGGVETTGYLGNGAFLTGTPTAGIVQGTTLFNLTGGGVSSSAIVHGAVTLTLVDASTNTWSMSGTLSRSDTNLTMISSGSKSLSPGPLDRVRFTTSNGTATFTAGKVNISYE